MPEASAVGSRESFDAQLRQAGDLVVGGRLH
jgi:hypothetical protein